MKPLFVLLLVSLVSLPLFGIEDGQVMYVGGTTPGLTAGEVGRVDLTPDTSLVFVHGSAKLTIPYAEIESYSYTREVTRHLGVLPAIGVGLLRMRQHRHFFRISYKHDNVSEVAVFEVPKQMPRTWQAVLQARAPQKCPLPACAANQN